MTRRRPKSLVKVTAAADICYIFDAIKKKKWRRGGDWKQMNSLVSSPTGVCAYLFPYLNARLVGPFVRALETNVMDRLPLTAHPCCRLATTNWPSRNLRARCIYSKQKTDRGYIVDS